MLAFQVQQYPLRLGLAEGTEPHQVPPGTLITAENVCWRKSGKLEKRFGTTQVNNTIVGGGSIAAAKRLFTRSGELCVIDGTSLYVWAPTIASWKSIGKVPNLGLTWATLADSIASVRAIDSATSATGYRVDAWITGDALTGVGSAGALYIQVVDTASRSLVISPSQQIASGCTGVRVLVIGTVAIVLTMSSAANLTALTVNLSAITVSATSNLRTDGVALSGNKPFDACVVGTNFVVAYNATGPLLKLYSYNASLVQQATGGITSESLGALSIGIDGASGETLYVSYVQGQSAGPRNLMCVAMADAGTLVQSVAPVTVETPAIGFVPWAASVCRYDSSNCIVSYVTSGISNQRTMTYQVSSAGTVNATSERGTFGTGPLSRPFMFASRCWMMLSEKPNANNSDRNSCLVEVEISARASAYTPHRLAGVVDILIGGVSAPGGGSFVGAPLPSVAVTGSSATLPVTFQSASNKDTVRQGARVVTLTSGASVPLDMWRATATGPEAFVAGGILSSYDGRSLFDYGFLRAPSFFSVTVAGAGGTLLPATYLYGVVLEYRSANGLLYRSPTQTTGTATTIGAGAVNKVTLVSQGYNLGNKQSVATLFGAAAALPTLHALYRSIGGGTAYQRLTIEPTYYATLVDTETESITISDTHGDADITGNNTPLSGRPAIYTTGGILDDYPPPAPVTMFQHVDRLWVLAGDQRTWWYSKAFGDDLGTAPGFHPNFRISLPETQTAGASMDDKAIFFSSTGIRYMFGLGPAANGQNSDFSTPTAIQSDVGCTSARSVVSTPDGIMFLSARGIYILTRALQLVWIGRPIKDTLATYPVITSAVLVATQNQVRFTCTDAASTIGVTLVYDYVERQWSTFKHTISNVYGGPIADACMWNGAWTFVSNNGVVYTETPTDYRDASGSYYVPMTLETSWINAAGPLAFQSVRNLTLHGVSASDHDLTVQCGFDNVPTYPQSVTFPATTTVVAIGPLEECNINIGTRRKCEAIRFKISDATPSAPGVVGTGQGPSFDMIGLEVGIKKGFKPNPATQKG